MNKRLQALIPTIFLLATFSKAQWFTQNFESSNNVSSYVSSSPNLGQFTFIDANANNVNFDIHQGRLRIRRTGNTVNTGSVCRNVNFPGSPKVMHFAFDFETQGAGQSGGDAFSFQFGNNFSNSAAIENNTNVAAQFGFNFSASNGGFRVWNMANNTYSANISGVQRIYWIINNDDVSITYFAPNGTNRTLASKRYEVWVGSTIQQTSQPLTNNNIPLNDFKINFRSQSNLSVFLDNFSVNALDGTFPGGIFPVGNTELLSSITNRDGVFHTMSNFGKITSNTTYNITSNLTAESGSFGLSQLQDMEAYVTKFQPSADQARIISNATPVNSAGMIRLIGADQIIFDGRIEANQSNPNATSLLTFQNSTNSPAFSFTNSSCNNIVSYSTIHSNANAIANGIIHIATSNTGLGNNYNSINNNVINGAMNTTRQAVFINGTSGAENTGNIISNNRIFNIYVPSSTSGHIVIGSHIRNLTIANNHLYQTQSYTPGNSATYISCIGGQGGIGSANVDSVFILNNWIGGSQPNCKGSAWSITTNSVMPLRIRGVDIRFDAGRYALVQGNVVNNINMAFTRTTNTNEFSFRGIYANSGLVDVMNNRIGSRDSLIFTIGTNNTAGLIPIIGIECSAANGKVENNVISGFDMNAISSSNGFEFSGIRMFGNTKATIQNNLIGSRTVANSIRINSQSIGINRLMGIQSNSTSVDTFSVNGNRIERLSNFSTNANATLNGIFHNGSAHVKIFQDTVCNLLSNGVSTNAGITQALAGILTLGNGNQHIFKNLIFGFTAENSPNNSVLVSGIVASGLGNNNIFANRIYDLKNESNGSVSRITGINTGNTAAGNIAIYNNMISLGLQPNGSAYTKNISITGINVSSNLQLNPVYVYYNSVLIDGSETATAARNFGFYWGSFSGGFPNHVLHIANNIFNVSRTGSLKYALGIENMASIPATLNNNIYFSTIASPFTRNAVEHNFASWKSLYNSDNYSDFQNIAAVSSSLTACSSLTFTNKATADLHLPMCETRISSKGRVVATPFPIYTDIDGDFRRGTDVGADEVHHIFAFTGIVSQAWNNPNNWHLKKVPSCADSVVVAPIGAIFSTPAGNVSVQRQPIIASNDTANFLSLWVQNGATLTAQGTAPIQNCWFDGVLRNSGTIAMAQNEVTLAGSANQSGVLNSGTSIIKANNDSLQHIPLRNTGMSLFMAQFNTPIRNISFNGSNSYVLNSLSILNNGLLLMNNSFSNSLKVQSPGSLKIDGQGELIANKRNITITGFVDQSSTGFIVGDSLMRLLVDGSDDLVGFIKFKPGHQIAKTLRINRTGSGRAQLATPLLVIDTLLMQAGILKTEAINLLTLGYQTRVIGNGSLTNYIEGPVKKQLNSLAKTTIPLGRNGQLRPFCVKPIMNTINAVTIEYFERGPTSEGMNTSNHDGDLDEVKNIEYYMLSREGSDEPMDLTFAWGLESQIGESGYGVMRVRMANWNPSINSWVNQGPDDHSASGNAQSGIVSIYSNTSSGAFTFATLYANPLPITLIEFKAEKNNQDVDLNWLTASETNNAYFDVERSLDAVKFEKIARIQGAGNSNTVLNYNHIDMNAALLPAKTLYYRLHQFDFNGESSLSEIVPIALNKLVQLQLLYASFGEENNVLLSFISPSNQKIQMSCYDQSGKLLLNTRFEAKEGINQLEESFSQQWSAGIYNILLTNGEANVVAKIVKK